MLGFIIFLILLFTFPPLAIILLLIKIAQNVFTKK